MKRKLNPKIEQAAIVCAMLAATFTGAYLGAASKPVELTEVKHVTNVTKVTRLENPIEKPELKEPEKISLGEYTLTAYCPCEKCCGKTDGITASGAKAKANHTIAADISLLPFGTIVEIDGIEYTVEDIGGAVKGNHIDIFFDTHEEALQFGKQKAEVYLK